MKRISKFFRLISTPETKPEPDFVEINSQPVPIVYRRHARAKNYVLRLQSDRTVVVTVPRCGTRKFAREFVASRTAWLEKQSRIMEARKIPPHILRPGMEILLRGSSVALQIEQQNGAWELCFGDQRVAIESPDANLRPAVEARLRQLAHSELVPCGERLARQHGAVIRKIVVRNQKSRWGSCSYNGAISLNWRLIQLPEPVRDYIIVHELMHLRELNHSHRFWSHVERACPAYQEAEDWLRHNSGRVGF